MTSEEKQIQKLEAELFQKIMNKLHELAFRPTPTKTRDLWNYACDVREEFLNALEKMEG